MATQVNLFGRVDGSSWAADTWVNVAPEATPKTAAGRAVSGVDPWVTPSSAINENPEPWATIGRIQRPGETAEEATASVAGAVKPTGMLMGAYTASQPSRTMQQYIQEQTTAKAAPNSYDEIISRYKSDPSSFNGTADDIKDISGEVGGRWNFGDLHADSLVVHHTAGRGSVEGVVQTFTERGFPAHFVIDREGAITQVLGLNQKGQHTKTAEDGSGISNSNSWGVEVMAKNDADVLPVQAAATVRLATYLKTYGLNPNKIVGHGAINSHKEATEGESIVNLLRQING